MLTIRIDGKEGWREPAKPYLANLTVNFDYIGQPHVSDVIAVPDELISHVEKSYTYAFLLNKSYDKLADVTRTGLADVSLSIGERSPPGGGAVPGTEFDLGICDFTN
jgi:hypothetical protein